MHTVLKAELTGLEATVIKTTLILNNFANFFQYVFSYFSNVKIRQNNNKNI